MCKINVISQEQLKIDVKLLLSANRKTKTKEKKKKKESLHQELKRLSIGTTTDDLE